MKEGLSKAAIKRIANSIHGALPSFDDKAFIQDAVCGLEGLELKARVNHIIGHLEKHLPPFAKTARILQALPKHWDYGHPDDPLRGFAAWPVIDYIATAGIEHPKTAYPTLATLTHLFSAEFAIRPFIEHYPQQSMAQLKTWSTSPDEHIRRLASEGCRPRLPWGIQLKLFIQDPSLILPILENLKSDSSKYVQKSVANNLNDISKDHPDLVVDLCKRWYREDNTPPSTQWIIKHACRTLIKDGYPPCLALFGFSAAKLKNTCIQCTPEVTEGESITFHFSAQSDKAQPLVIDYAIDFLRNNGKHNRKVFKLKTLEVKKGEHFTLTKLYSFKAITTRKYYKGTHRIHIQVNGIIVASTDFLLM